MLSNILPSDNDDRNFKDHIYTYLPEELQDVVDQMITEGTFLKPWKQGLLFDLTEKLTYSSNLKFSCSRNFDKIVFGGRLLERNSRTEVLTDLYDFFPPSWWKRRLRIYDLADGFHCCTCFDKKFPKVFIVVTSFFEVNFFF